jgi:DNA-binding MarR family transcriptional regulator
MDGELRDYGLSVSQYACLEILASRPRISNADLARDAFVSRQAMHQLLPGLQKAGLVAAVGQGRGQRYFLTAAGRTRLRAASSTVAAIEQRMLAALSSAEREQLHRRLSICTTALGSTNQRTYWVSTISRDHVQLGVDGGFTQTGHGKASGLKRLKADDWLIFAQDEPERRRATAGLHGNRSGPRRRSLPGGTGAGVHTVAPQDPVRQKHRGADQTADRSAQLHQGQTPLGIHVPGRPVQDPARRLRGDLTRDGSRGPE